jgi:hypothetical protein
VVRQLLEDLRAMTEAGASARTDDG